MRKSVLVGTTSTDSWSHKFRKGVSDWFSNVNFWFSLNLISLFATTVAHFVFASFTGAGVEVNWGLEKYYAASNLLLGCLVSFLFYYLVVAWPEARRKKLLKSNALARYKRTKKSILWQVVFASRKGGRHDLSTQTDDVDSLMELKAFQNTFENGKESTQGFYAFQNQMSGKTHEFEEIILNLKILQRQFEFLIDNYPIENGDALDRIRGIAFHLERLIHTEPGYDGSKPLCEFIWEMFSGWEMMKGYQLRDQYECTRTVLT